MAANELPMSGARLSIIVSLVLLLTRKTKLQDIKGIAASCKVHNDVIVDIDPGQHRYYPYLVKLPRCAGSVSLTSPNIKRCAPTLSNQKSYSVYTIPSFRPATVKLDTHLSCAGKCVKSSSSCNSFQTWDGNKCQCDCKFINAPSPSPCKQPLIWTQSKCNCECPISGEKCSNKREWNSETCTCTCKKRYLNRCIRKNKLVNQETCKCIDLPGLNATASARGGDIPKDCVKSTTVVMIAFFEFLFLVVIFIIIYCCYLKNNQHLSSSHSNSGTKWPWERMKCLRYNKSWREPNKQEHHIPLEQHNGNTMMGISYEEKSCLDDHQENSCFSNKTDSEEYFHQSEGYDYPVQYASANEDSSVYSKVTPV